MCFRSCTATPALSLLGCSQNTGNSVTTHRDQSQRCFLKWTDLARSWCKENGLETSLVPICTPGGLRGLAAAADIHAGDTVISVPDSLLVTPATAKRSDLVRSRTKAGTLANKPQAVGRGVRTLCKSRLLRAGRRALPFRHVG